MNMRLRLFNLLVVIAAITTFSRVIAAGEVGQGNAPRTNWGNSGGASDVASKTRNPPDQFYGVGVTPAVYLVNFLIMYMANPNKAAEMPAYRVPIPTALSDCLLDHPQGCSYSDHALYFDDNTKGIKGYDLPPQCRTTSQYEPLGPSIAKRPDQINEPLGLDRANQIAGQLKIDKSMILTDEEYECTIGIPPRVGARKTIFACLNNLTNSNGNTNIPLSSYGLAITTTDQSPDEDPTPPPAGYVQSLCAPYAPCLEFNDLFGPEGAFRRIAESCGWLDKLERLRAVTPIKQFAAEGHECQALGGADDGGACIVQSVPH